MKIEIEPVPKPRMTQSDKWNQRPCVIKYWEYKEQLQQIITEIPQPCKITFILPMPNSWSSTKKNIFNGTPHLMKPDLDNLLKGLLDAIYDNDAVIWNVHCSKLWGFSGSIIIKE